jgi:hypothetical protein
LIDRRLLAERHSRQDHARRADAALRAAVFHESALQRVIPAQPFNRRHTRTGDLRDGDKARVHGSAVYEHRARPALPFAAAFLGARQAAVLTQDVEQPPHRVGANLRSPSIQHEGH